MAANTTSGNFQSYDLGEGIRIFQGLAPDIVMIQEFNFGNKSAESIRAFVDEAFGPEFQYYREGGNEQLPNGVISRFPMVAAGEWNDPNVSNRDFAWARLAIPGDRYLWVVSVHFLTTSSSNRNAQAAALLDYVEAFVPAEDYLVIGGDFNTNSFTESALLTLGAVVDISGRPADQAGTQGTNANRSRPYDQILPDPALSLLEVPVVIAGHSSTYGEGLVFDSRVFTPLSAVSPVQFGDSGAPSMQHMAVVRDFLIPLADSLLPPSAYPTGFGGQATDSSITLTWTDVEAFPVPDGYLVHGSLSPALARPTAGEPIAEDTDLSDGSAWVFVDAGEQTVTLGGLPTETTYYFTIYPYVAGDPLLFKTDGGAPGLTVTTLPLAPIPLGVPDLGPVYYRHATGFTITWGLVEEADGYRLDLSESSTFSQGSGEILLAEGFDASTAVPAGWFNSGTGVSTSAIHYSSAPNCRSLGPGHFLETPPVDHPAQLRFFVDSSNSGNGKVGTVSYRIGNDAWLPLHSFVASTSGNVETVDLTSGPNLSGESGVRFRFESDFFTWYLDDVEVTGVVGAGYVSGYQDRAVGAGDFHRVEGLEPGTFYYYRLRADNASETSADSMVGAVQTTIAGTPFSVWASDNGLVGATLTSDFDGDGRSDFSEFAFGTDPLVAQSSAESKQLRKTEVGLQLTHRQSIAPGLEWRYVGAPSLIESFQPLGQGVGVNQYKIIEVIRLGPVNEVTIEVNTGGLEHYFLRVEVEPNEP